MPDTQEQSGRPLRVLLIDDNADDRKLVIRDLKQVYPNLQAQEIVDPPALEAALERCDFDLVVTDYQIRWTDGLSVLQAIKDRSPDCPVVMFTGTGDEEVAVEAMKIGLDDYVVKAHHDRVRLIPAVRSALDRAVQRRALQEAEENRERLEEELRQRVAQLAERDQCKDQFLAMLGHELRNPLGAARNAAAILTQRGLDTPQAARALTVLNRQIEHMARLVNDLLDVARVTQGRIDIHRQPVEVRAVAESAVTVSQPEMEARGQVLSVSLPTHPIWFDADPTRLEQVLVNLLDNASKFSGCGDHIWLAAEVEQEAEWITLRVRDEGAGIPADLLPHLFEVFSQADRSLDRSAGGLGVGLALVKAIVNLHAGTVSAYSAGPGQGSEFVVRLPVRTGVRRSAPDPREVVRTAGSSQRILVVEDIRDAAETLQELLHEMGHDVRIALHGSTALVLAQEFRPEVVLLDIGLPGMDGYEVARRLRLAGMADAVMIALTGYGMEEDRRRTREAGFQHHLTKPVDPAELQQLLSSTATELRAQPAAG